MDIVVSDTGLNTSDNTSILSGVNASDETQYDGHYSIVTSEKELSDKEIRDIYKGL